MTTRAKTRFQEKELSHNGSILVFEYFFVATAATVCQEFHFCTRLRTEGQELAICISVLKFVFESTAALDGLLQSLDWTSRLDWWTDTTNDLYAF